MSDKKNKKKSYTNSITQQKVNCKTYINICKFCNSDNLITKPALAKDYQKIFCNDCGKYQGLVKAIASNKNQEVVL